MCATSVTLRNAIQSQLNPAGYIPFIFLGLPHMIETQTYCTCRKACIVSPIVYDAGMWQLYISPPPVQSYCKGDRPSAIICRAYARHYPFPFVSLMSLVCAYSHSVNRTYPARAHIQTLAQYRTTLPGIIASLGRWL